MSNTAPVLYEHASEHSHRTISATSSTVPSRFIGLAAIMAFTPARRTAAPQAALCAHATRTMRERARHSTCLASAGSGVLRCSYSVLNRRLSQSVAFAASVAAVRGRRNDHVAHLDTGELTAQPRPAFLDAYDPAAVFSSI